MASHSNEATVLASDQESSPFLQMSTPASVEEFPLLQPTVRVGRSPHNEIVISYPTISRHHFEIVKTDTGYRIRDLDSKLGLVYGDRPPVVNSLYYSPSHIWGRDYCPLSDESDWPSHECLYPNQVAL
ncbi:FHA domain-containing protein [Thermosynechococcus sp. JY1334]|uniref:FHA domain-containing protein n=1 Tax=unclassified Thermosynechococcus TaxID=2622553 RepID=UPI002672E1DD|nr:MULTISPECIES: FHA domain-containing protein [unclassified Thermosynechococcus]MDR7896957.1 FHA domain-containing protein [Thermosynechococcus sp. JY1332]MDR7904354.1 FHA domain-containing protein [Thermosynechococcus sp. JY1334]MDR7920834.1 FHA domain-containing protein [Thermosynechococcus sp. HY213]MDR7992191.1 FHA domain-containing protein [Thermosynechococcus sp. TG252]WKT86601.1 FHA domain-containing protein [Thermosynechococcus sp. JY1339]